MNTRIPHKLRQTLRRINSILVIIVIRYFLRHHLRIMMIITPGNLDVNLNCVIVMIIICSVI